MLLHQIGDNIVPIVAIVMIFGGGAIQHFVKSLGKAIEAKASQQNGVNTETAKAIEELRREVVALRETSTQFDMSFDAAITRLENRVDRIEGQSVQTANVPLAPTTPMPAHGYNTQTTPQEVTLGAGRGA